VKPSKIFEKDVTAKKSSNIDIVAHALIILYLQSIVAFVVDEAHYIW